MSSAAVSSASSSFFLALASASPGGRRRTSAGSPPFHTGAGPNFAFWREPPPPRAPRDAALVRAEAEGGGKDAPPERSSGDAASRSPRARRKAVSWSTPIFYYLYPLDLDHCLFSETDVRCIHAQVSKRRDPLQPVGRYGSGTGNTASRSGAALAAVEIKSIVAAPPTSIVKFPAPG